MLKNLLVWIFGIQIVMGSGLVDAQVIKAALPFDESVWRVEQLQNQKKTIQSYQEEKNFTHFSFNPYTHKVVGSGLCNKFLGKYEQKGNQITIHDLVTTHQTCLSSDVNAQDNRFFSYLKSVQYFSVHGKFLRLDDAQNNPLMVARWIK